MALTYADYLKIDTLLDLQEPKSSPPEHDEHLFIVIHQVYELWFKLMLHEFEKVKRNFSAGELYESIATFKRCRTMMKTLVQQLDILETMTPMSFKSFRDRLETASGFQSVQFRELEFVLGFKRPDTLRYYTKIPGATETLRQRLAAPSVYDHFYDFLETQGVPIPAAVRDKPAESPTLPNEEFQDALLEVYQTKPNIGILLELMTDFDEGMQEWRYRHVKLVERTIGNKHGTGGSPGIEFLKKTLFMATFPDLWAIRHKL